MPCDAFRGHPYRVCHIQGGGSIWVNATEEVGGCQLLLRSLLKVFLLVQLSISADSIDCYDSFGIYIYRCICIYFKGI